MTVFQSKADFKEESLDQIDDNLISAKDVLADITEDRRLCLKELGLRIKFAEWVKEALPGKFLIWGLTYKFSMININRLYCNRE